MSWLRPLRRRKGELWNWSSNWKTRDGQVRVCEGVYVRCEGGCVRWEGGCVKDPISEGVCDGDLINDQLPAVQKCSFLMLYCCTLYCTYICLVLACVCSA